MKTVMFCGCSCVPFHNLDEFNNDLKTEVKKAIDEGATEFLFYECGNFSVGCSLVVKDFKKKYPKIRSVMYDMHMINPIDRSMFDSFETFDLEKYPFWLRPTERCKRMVDKSDMVIMYVGSNEKLVIDTLIYARENRKQVVLL